MKIQRQNPQELILATVNELSSFIAPTYGPAGRGVLIDEETGETSVLDDGHSIVEKFELEDEFQNAVVKLIKETSRRTNKRAGDGTTTSILLLAAIMREVFSEQTGFVKPNYKLISESIKKGLSEAVIQLRAGAKKIKTQKDLEAVAYNVFNDTEHAKQIAQVIHAVGTDGVVSIADSDTFKTTTEVVSGFSIDRGYLSPYMAEDEEETELKNPVVILTDETISTTDQIASLIEQSIKEGRTHFLIVADDITGEALNTLVMNKLRDVINVVGIKAPSMGDKRREILEDLAIFVGGTVITSRAGRTLATTTLSDCGSAEKVIASKDKTILLDGSGDKKAIAERISTLRPFTEKGSDFDREGYKNRIASLSCGVGIVRVGAHTDAERSAIKAKVEDAIHATSHAFRGGVTDGGGIAFTKLETSSPELNAALQYPRRVLLDNGADALTENVHDAVDVVIAALESAVSMATLLITTSGISTTKKDKPKE